MEVFEFINLVEAHGKMRMMGVLTHIDQVRNRKLIQKREQFWKKSVPVRNDDAMLIHKSTWFNSVAFVAVMCHLLRSLM